jgi:hypothetical protein
MEEAAQQTIVQCLLAPIQRIQRIQQNQFLKTENVGIIKVAQQVMQNDGIIGFWRGTSLMAFQIFGVAVIQNVGKKPANKYSERAGNLTNMAKNTLFTCASFGFIYATDVIHTKLLVHPTAISFVEMAKQIFLEKGVLGFFQGFSANVVRYLVLVASNYTCASVAGFFPSGRR